MKRMYAPLAPLLALLFLALAAGTGSPAAELSLEKGDRICLVGNELGERMQHHNWWETLLYQRFPGKDLAVRNLCFPGDEPFQRIRSMDFGEPDEHLVHSKASVLLYFFGFNESFAGKLGVSEFSADMTKLVEHTQQQDYSGRGAPRIVLISPIAFENTGDSNLPEGTEHNLRLALYTQALKEVAAATGVGFVDLFQPTHELFEASTQRLTLNGAHLNEAGYQALAPILMIALFGPGTPSIDNELKLTVDDKNFHWWHRYRAVNGYSIYGARGKAGQDGTGRYDNTDVMERERTILDQMTANRDQRIWALARGERVPESVDDSNTLPFIEPVTNVGGADDQQRKAGKLGTLDYLNAAQQQKLFKLAPGYEINLVASEEEFPELANPVALNFDNEGRLWVSTMASYPHWKPKSVLDDKLLIFEDYDHDGKADECKVFARGLHQPTGFEIGNGGVYVAQQPDLLFMTDTDGDDVADTRIRQRVGFDTADSHHGIAAFEWGPDGALYFNEGTFKFSQVESPYGLTRLHEAGIWRYETRTERIGVHASLAFANPWGHVFDRWGQDFIADASPGFSYWAAPITGYIEYPLKHPGGSQHRRIASQTGGDPNFSFPTFYNKRTRPSAGCELVSSRHFPADAQGNFLLTNCIVDRAVLNHRVSEEGSGFAGVEVEPIVSCDDGNFRPIDIQFAPDGSLYLVDWHNALIGHLQHNLRDPSRDHSHGRIWRITYKDRPLLTPPTIAGAPVDALLELLKEPEDRTRYRVRRELAQNETNDVIAAVEKWIDQLDSEGDNYQLYLLEAFWIYQTHNVVNEPLLKRLLETTDPRARAAATRALSFWVDRVSDPLGLLHSQINDTHPRVRLEAVRACSFIHSTDSIEVALDVLNHDMDHYLEYTLSEMMRSMEAILGRSAQQMAHAHHAHHDGGEMDVEQPKPLVFLDKTPKIVKFQLDRLPASQLLLIDRSSDAASSRPVYDAILLRPGVSRQDREEAAEALSRLNGTSMVSVLLEGIGQLDLSKKSNRSVMNQLAAILLRQTAADLSENAELLAKETASQNEGLRAVAMAAMIQIGDSRTAWSIGRTTPQGRIDFLASVSMVPGKNRRVALRENVLDCLENSRPVEVRRAAIVALASIPDRHSENFQLVAPLVKQRALRSAAVQTLLQIPSSDRPAPEARQVVDTLVRHAEQTSTAKRTTESFLDAMHLADELLARLPVNAARGYRERLREVVVRVVRISTVEEEMRYDTPFFAVEAGRPVQLVLRNVDLMPHNLVIATPGNLREVAQQAAGLSPAIDARGRQFVPETSEVLFATRMVPAHSQDVLTFTAPREPGEYSYVCTFPNHWVRMYGVMVVVDDLEAWQADAVEPVDPLGITRSLVQNWAFDDFQTDLAATIKGRQTEIGQRLFKEATCLQCHKMRGEGGVVGPELTDVFERLKGDHAALLRELVDPSNKVDPKYALYNVLTLDGRIISGIVTGQNADSVTVLTNPDNPQPQVISRDEIDEMIKSSTSMMPKGLLDRYTQEEIYEILAYMTAGKK
jgi:putative membrane-bound dehydrogenase-like protein